MKRGEGAAASPLAEPGTKRPHTRSKRGPEILVLADEGKAERDTAAAGSTNHPGEIHAPV